MISTDLQIPSTDLFTKAVAALASGMSRTPVLYGPNGKPLQKGAYQYQRKAAKREGSMQNWIPRRLFTRQAESRERERIVERSVDLVQSDPHAAGIVDSFATTIVGPGLQPHAILDVDALGMDKTEVRRIQAQERAIYQAWAPHADAGGRMTDGEIQFLVQRCVLQYGEYICLLPMLKDKTRPYSLACQVIHPLRMKTPSDLYSQGNIRDGVELGEYGEAKAYWIKKADPASPLKYMSDTSANFLRIPAKQGHRWKVLHKFICEDPDQVRGMPFFAPAMKFFRDLSDYLDAELVANVVTAAFALFIETGGTDPSVIAEALAHHTDEETDGTEIRYEEIIPGQVMYGESGQKPHSIAANRPGTTFQVFVKEIKKALALSLNMPYVSLFKDVEETNYAGFRSAMLDAWRVFTHRRQWLGQGFCQPRRTMLLEEAWLRGELDVLDFYERMHLYTACKWIGTPKGNIEPIKEAQADILLIKNNLKTRGQTIMEQGGERQNVFDDLEEEQEELETRGLPTGLEEQVPVKEKGDAKSD